MKTAHPIVHKVTPPLDDGACVEDAGNVEDASCEEDETMSSSSAAAAGAAAAETETTAALHEPSLPSSPTSQAGASSEVRTEKRKKTSWDT